MTHPPCSHWRPQASGYLRVGRPQLSLLGPYGATYAQAVVRAGGYEQFAPATEPIADTPPVRYYFGAGDGIPPLTAARLMMPT